MSIATLNGSTTVSDEKDYLKALSPSGSTSDIRSIERQVAESSGEDELPYGELLPTHSRRSREQGLVKLTRLYSEESTVGRAIRLLDQFIVDLKSAMEQEEELHIADFLTRGHAKIKEILFIKNLQDPFLMLCHSINNALSNEKSTLKRSQISDIKESALWLRDHPSARELDVVQIQRRLRRNDLNLMPASMKAIEELIR